MKRDRNDDDSRWEGMKDIPDPPQARAQDGRYTFDGNMSRPCVCGHTLGDHAGAAPHECFTHTFSKSDPRYAECDCPKFRPQRRK